MANKQFRNPLTTLWTILGNIGGILGVSSMVQTWAEDLFQWQQAIGSIIEGYRAIVRPVFEFLFSWLPWAIPAWISDYLFLGVIFVGAYSKVWSQFAKIAPIRKPAGKTQDKLPLPSGSRLWDTGDDKSPYRKETGLEIDWSENSQQEFDRAPIPLRVVVVQRLLLVPAWPLLFFIVHQMSIMERVLNRNDLDNGFPKGSRIFFLWIATIIFGFMVLLLINSQLES